MKAQAFRATRGLIAALWGTSVGSLGAEAPAATTAAEGALPAGPGLEVLRASSLEDLLVTSVSRKPEPAFEAPAAVTVITGEEIKRSGVRTLAEALRLAPGMDVARVNAGTWAVTARGFNGQYANKLLVLIDGRSVYHPANGGVEWGIQDVLLEDVEHIEVIRGPGGTLWGANAVNGVVNVITKHSAETLGGYAEGGYGSVEQGFGAVRYGFRSGEEWTGRAYVKYDNHGPFEVDGGDANDAWSKSQAGFRTDWGREANAVTFQGDAFYSERDGELGVPIFTPPYASLLQDFERHRGGNLLGRWTHTFDNATDLQLQLYWDNWAVESDWTEYEINTVDLDFQHRLLLPGRQELIYGLGYRYLPDHWWPVNPYLLLEPETTYHSLYSGFVQDDLTLVEDHLHLIAGIKYEHNDYTGSEWQPNARLLWTPSSRHSVWGAVARPIRSPTRTDSDLQALLPGVVPTGQPAPFDVTFIRGEGNPDFLSEELLSFELGYRVKPLDRLSFDVSGYYFDYDRLSSPQFGAPGFVADPLPGHLEVPARNSNDGNARTYGAEVAAEVQVAEGWRLRGGYDYFGEESENTTVPLDYSPHNEFFLRSSADLPANLYLDLWLRYRDEISALNLSGYVDADVRLAWRCCRRIEVSVVGQNLCSDSRREWGAGPFALGGVISEIPRSVYGMVSIRF